MRCSHTCTGTAQHRRHQQHQQQRQQLKSSWFTASHASSGTGDAGLRHAGNNPPTAPRLPTCLANPAAVVSPQQATDSSRRTARMPRQQQHVSIVCEPLQAGALRRPCFDRHSAQGLKVPGKHRRGTDAELTHFESQAQPARPAGCRRRAWHPTSSPGRCTPRRPP